MLAIFAGGCGKDAGMEPDALLDDQWPCVLSLLPEDLEESAREHDAIVRKRVIRTAADLLRL
jgi:hypothetical protein